MDNVDKVFGFLKRKMGVMAVDRHAAWVVSWTATRFDRKTRKQVPVVEEITVIGTDNACIVAGRKLAALAEVMGVTDANEAVQMKRVGYLPPISPVRLGA